MTDQFGGVLVDDSAPKTDKFGGVAVETDRFGGVAVDPTHPTGPDFSAFTGVPQSPEEFGALNAFRQRSFDEQAAKLPPGPQTIEDKRQPTDRLLDDLRNSRIGKALLGDPGAVAGGKLEREGLVSALGIPAAVGTKGGQFAKAGLEDIAANVAGPTEQADFTGNLKELLQGGGKTQLPAERALEQARQEEIDAKSSGWQTVSADIALGLTDLAPKIAMMEAAPGGILGQSGTSAAVFGFNDQGKFQPRQAAFAAAFPFATRAASVATDAAITKAVQRGFTWAENPSAQKALHLAANQATMNAIILAQERPELNRLAQENPEEYKRELAKIIGSNLAFSIPEALRSMPGGTKIDHGTEPGSIPPESPTAKTTTKPPAPPPESTSTPAQAPSSTGLVSVSGAFDKALDALSGKTGVSPDELLATLKAAGAKQPSEASSPAENQEKRPDAILTPTEEPASEPSAQSEYTTSGPEAVAEVRRNEGDEAANTVDALHQLGISTIDTHGAPGQPFTVRLEPPWDSIDPEVRQRIMRLGKVRISNAMVVDPENPVGNAAIDFNGDVSKELLASAEPEELAKPQEPIQPPEAAPPAATEPAKVESEADRLGREFYEAMRKRDEDFRKRLTNRPPKPKITLPELLNREGRQRVMELLSDWDEDAELSDDGKYITTFSDPRNQTGRMRVPVREFLQWVEQQERPKAEPTIGQLPDFAPEPPKEPESPPAKPGRRLFIRKRPDRQTDILDDIQELGGLRPPDKSDKGGEYDAWKEAMQGTARLLINRSAKHRPDTIIPELQSLASGHQRIHNADDLYNAIRGAVAEREGLREKGGGRDEQDRRFWEAATNPKNPNGLVKINVSDLKVGHKFRLKGPEISNDELEVTHIDPDTLEVTVKDGRKMGTQTLPDGTEIWVQRKYAPEGISTLRVQPERPEPDQFQKELHRTGNKQTRDRLERLYPQLRPGEKGTGELLQGEDQPFNLMGEKGTDAERIAAEKAAAEKTAREGKEIAEQQQQTLPVFQPEKDKIEDFLNRAIEATKPKTGLETGEVSMGLARLPVWLTQELAHGSLKVVRAAYKGGKALAHAIEDGIQWLRTEAGKSFNEKEAREWLTQAANEPETAKGDDWKAIHTERESVTKDLADLNAEIDKAGGRRNASTDVKNKADAAIAKHKALTAQLRQSPGYVEDLLNQFNAAKDDMAREDLKGELTMIEPDLLNRVYRDTQTRGIIPASQKLPEPFSSLQQLTDWLKAHDVESPRRSIGERLNLAKRAADAIQSGKDALQKVWNRSVALAKAGYEIWKSPPIDSDFRALVKDWNVFDEQTGLEGHRFQQAINRRVEDPRRRAAIMVWIQAGGMQEAVEQQLAMVPDRFKPVWKAATKLTADEKALANQIRSDWAVKLDIGQNAGLVDRGRQNYGPTVWSTAPQVAEGDSTFAIGGALETRKGTPGNPNARLDPRNPFFSFHKSFPTYFDGIMAGGVPETMDVGKLVAYYHQAFNKALSSRAVVKAMMDAKAKDGRPVVILSGRADPITSGDGETKGYVVDSSYKGHEAQTADGRPYQAVNHFALKDWKFVQRTEDGKPILARADMLVHPDHVGFLKNVLGKQYYDARSNRYYDSPIRQYAIGRGLLRFNRFLKESKFALSPFHLATLAEHALSHTVNPWTGNFKLDLNDPKQRRLVRGGVDLGFSGERVDFQEGLSSHGGLWSKIPGIGDLSVKFTDFLFKDYLPSIKMKMALEALDRNMKCYSGKLTEEQIYDLTASQANAAFGSQNYRLLGRNPMVRDLLSLSFVAPDFLASRMKFVGQAFQKHGAEQRRALFVMAAVSYIGARVINALVDPDNDPHWGLKDAFSVIYKGRRYGLRTVVGDIWHAVTDPRSFWYNRFSPITRTVIEASTKKDWRGVNRTTVEQMEDVASWIVPTSMEGLVPGAVKRDSSVLESAGRSMGVMSRKDTPATRIADMARDFNRDSKDPQAVAYQKARDQETLPESAYRDLDTLLESNDLKAAKKEYDRLVKEGHKPNVIATRYRNFRPFTGTVERDKAFYNSLSLRNRKLYDRARAEHQEQNERFKKIVPNF